MSKFHKQRSKTAMSLWREKILSQQASGEAVAAYCEKRDICACSFYAWRKRLGMNAPVTAPAVIQKTVPGVVGKAPTSGFLRIMPDEVKTTERPVEVRACHPVLWIETPGGYRVSVGGRADLAQVLEVLGQQAGLGR